MYALILYDREVSSKVLELQRRTHGHHGWMFSHVVFAGLHWAESSSSELQVKGGILVDEIIYRVNSWRELQLVVLVLCLVRLWKWMVTSTEKCCMNTGRSHRACHCSYRLFLSMKEIMMQARVRGVTDFVLSPVEDALDWNRLTH